MTSRGVVCAVTRGVSAARVRIVVCTSYKLFSRARNHFGIPPWDRYPPRWHACRKLTCRNSIHRSPRLLALIPSCPLLVASTKSNWSITSTTSPPCALSACIAALILLAIRDRSLPWISDGSSRVGREVVGRKSEESPSMYMKRFLVASLSRSSPCSSLVKVHHPQPLRPRAQIYCKAKLSLPSSCYLPARKQSLA